MFCPNQADVKHVTPGAGPFWLQGHELNKSCRSLQVDATYQISRPCGFKQEYVFMFFLYQPFVIHGTSSANLFISQTHNLNRLGSGLLVDATYKISRLYALWLQTRRCLTFVSQKSIFSRCDLDMQWTKTFEQLLKRDI